MDNTQAWFKTIRYINEKEPVYFNNQAYLIVGWYDNKEYHLEGCVVLREIFSPEVIMVHWSKLWED